MADADLTHKDDSARLTLARFAEFTPPVTEIRKHRIVGFDSRDARARPFNLLRTSFAKN